MILLSMMSYNKFDEFLEKIGHDLAARRSISLNNLLQDVVHVYYNDYLYSDIRCIATLEKSLEFRQWPDSYEFVVSSIGMRAKYFFFIGGAIM